MTNHSIIRIMAIWLATITSGMATVYNHKFKDDTSIPVNIPVNTTVILMDSNLLTELADNALSSFSQLKVASFPRNLITVVSPSAFTGTMVDSLYLTGNQLAVMPNLLSIGGTLLKLDIAYNAIRHLELEKLQGLRQLEILDVTGNKIQGLENISALGNLTVLRVSHNENLGPNITQNTFLGTSITDLHMDNIGLTSFQMESLYKIRLSLERLWISGQTMPNVSCVKHLNRFSKLHTLDISYNGLTVFPDISCLKPTLRMLRIEGNKITSIPNTTFVGFSHLLHLDISNNPLGEIPTLHILQPLQAYLRDLHITHIGMTSINNGTLQSFVALQELSIGSPEFIFENLLNLTSIPKLRRLNIQDSHINNINGSFFHKQVSLKQFTLDGSGISCMEKVVLFPLYS